MANRLDENTVPPRWSVEGVSPGTRGGVLRIGQKRIPLADIERVAGAKTRDRPVAGLMISAAAFLIVATLIALLVFDFAWRPRFLIATAFLTFLAIAGLQEILKLAPQQFFELTIELRGRAPQSFASADAVEIDAFMAALRSAGVPIATS